MNEHDLIARGFVKESDGSWRKPKDKTGGVASGAVPQQGHVHEPVAEDEGKAYYQSRCLVRITSFRRRLLDDDNPYPKHFVDALKEARIVHDDSQKFCKIEMEQREVFSDAAERTEIEIIPL